MRLDKYLKVSRIIKRRTVANSACAAGRVSLNGKTAKPSSVVSVNDIIAIRFGEHLGQYRVLQISDTVKKAESSMMYEVLEEDSEIMKERSLT